MNSPATLSKLMDRVLGYGELEPAIFVYLDDIVVASHTFEEHIQKLRDLARRLKEANLYINLENPNSAAMNCPTSDTSFLRKDCGLTRIGSKRSWDLRPQNP